MHFGSPLYVVWEITRNCNARCIHCYSDASFGRGFEDSWKLDECYGLIDQLVEAGVIILGFSGGEIFMRDDWHKIVGYATKKGLRVSLATNGLKIKPDTAQLIADLDVSNVSVSLDGATAKVHEKIRKIPGIFDAACRAIKILRDADVTTTANYTPMTLNHQDVEGVVRLAYEIGANKANLTEYVYLSRGGINLMLKPEELYAVIQTWLRLADEFNNKMVLNWHDCRVALLVNDDECDKYTGCGAGSTHCRITEDKFVTPCVVMPHPVGSLKEQPFMDIWRNAPQLHRIRTRDSITSGNCADCEHKSVCGGCRASSFAHYGTPFAGDPMCWVKPEGGVHQPQGCRSCAT